MPFAALDARPYELNTPAGVVDLRTGALRPADPGLLHTRSTAAAPDFERRSEALINSCATPSVTTPTWRVTCSG
ncbi:hypothetical protein [Actinoplanes subtropicus]|uniref:hypothetical protein n=1 Tax=Actinoplanes subtropicus TaxID=543632 RepID=UPI003CCC302D